MPYHLFYHPDIKKEDLSEIPRNMQGRICKAIKERLLTDPGKYGEPLKRGLRGYRKLRVGNYRVIYKVDKENILVFKIGHRKEVYRRVQIRIES